MPSTESRPTLGRVLVASTGTEGDLRFPLEPTDGWGSTWDIGAFYSPQEGVGGELGWHEERLGDDSARASTTLWGGSRGAGGLRATGAYALTDDYRLDLGGKFRYGNEDFFGVGALSRESDVSPLTVRRLEAFVGARHHVDNFYLSVGWRLDDATFVKADGGVYPALDLPDKQGLLLSGLQAEFGYDSRDSERDPERGTWIYVRGFSPSRGVLSPRTFQEWDAAIHQNFWLSTHHQDLGFHVVTTATTGEVPFQVFPYLGKTEWLPAVRAGRFQDRNALSAVALYRRKMGLGFSLGPYLGCGAVSYDWANLFPSPWKFGLGLVAAWNPSRSRGQGVKLAFGEFASELIFQAGWSSEL